MRKVLLFLALVAGGLAALLLLRERTPRSTSSSAERTAAPSAGGQFTRIPLQPEEPGGKQGSVEIQLQGPLDVTQFEGTGEIKKPIRKLHAADAQSLGSNLYVLREMVVRNFDPENGSTTAQLASPRSRLKIEMVDGKWRIGEGDKALLSDVEATIYAGAPVTPLTLKIPLLEWRIGANRWLSDQPVQISGSGLEARGDALDADLAGASLVLPKSGSIELDLPGGARTTLAATGPGPIAIRSVRVEAEPLVEIVASEGARLSARGEEPLQLEAKEIRLLARGGTGGKKEFDLVSADASGQVIAESRGDTFRSDKAHFRVTPQGHLEHADLDGAVSLRSGEGAVTGAKAAFDFSATGRPASAHVEGDVALERGEDVFHAQSADFTFDAGGKLARAALAGEPGGTVAIGRYLPPDQRELRTARAEIAGLGPLILEFAGRTKIDLTGPGDLKVPEADLAIHAERSLAGEASEDKKIGSLAADGAVTVRWSGDDLASESMRFSTSVSDAGETIVDAESFGPTTLHGARADGSTVSLDAQQGLTARSTGKRLVVSSARQVAISALGPGAFRARAAVVRDFDWKARAFSAEGEVSYESESGSASADRAVARSAEDIELTGSAGHPAHYSRKGGSGEARFEEAGVEGLSIHATQDALVASGDVHADLAAAGAKYRLEGGEVQVGFGPPSGPEPGAPRPFEARASSAVRARIETAKGASTLACEHLRIAGTTQGETRAGAPPVVVASDVRAEGAVNIDWRAEGGIVGEGDLFTLDPQGRGRLSADPGKRVHASGRLARDTAPYALESEWVEFAKERLEARKVSLRLQPQDVREQGGVAPAAAAPLLSQMSADHMLATPAELLLEGAAHVDGRTQQGESWAIDAGSVRIGGKFTEKKGFSLADFDIVQAWDGFEARLGTRAGARGKRLEGKEGRVRLEGEPAELSLGPIAMRSAWIEYGAENMLLATDKGELRPAQETENPWSITYESLQPFDREDKTILALRNPVFRKEDVEMRALWMLFWVDREEWRRSGRKAMSETASGPDLRVKNPGEAPGQAGGGREGGGEADREQSKLARLRADIQRFRSNPMSKVLSEAYVEGNIELTQGGQRVARASAIYLDIVDGHGWVQDADVFNETEIRDQRQQLRIRAEWMRVSSDLSLRADKATLSFCGYDEPHYVVETGDLRLKPNGGGIRDYDVLATNNALRFENGWVIPLPPLIYAKDEQGNPIIENISLGNSAKFGAMVGATFNVGLGSVGNSFGKFFESFLSLPKASVKGHWRFNADYLGSRGVLLGTGLELKSGDRFKLEADFSAIPDRNEDRGLIRVPKDDRSLLRDWFRARARYNLSKDEWFDLALTRQSDAGVQSEFFEGDFLRYELKDNFLHWRKASGPWYLSASAKPLIEDRTDIEELPKAGVFRGRAPLGRLFGLELLYTGYLDAAHLRRKEGDPQFYGIYPDLLHERDVTRADTDHRIEVPFSLGVAGLRATPWAEARATIWDRGVNPGSSPSRSGALAGFDLSTTLWRRYGNGVLHAISPFVSVHGDLAEEESDGAPVSFDRTEDPIQGRFVDVGLRSRAWKPDALSRFDVEVRATHGANLPNGAPDGMQPVSVLSELLTWIGGIPVGVTHDGRYDLDAGETVYSRSYLGFRPFRAWDVEFGYNRGVDPSGAVLYEAASAATRYRAGEKWELEVGETISVHDDRGLASNLTLRRLGHDFVTETEIGYTAGEGARFSVNLTPLLTWRPSGIGLLDRWLGR
jgi:hypothetical protein